MLRVNKEIIAKLNPCKGRFDVYLENYADFDGSVEEFIALEKVTYNDKIWVLKRIVDAKHLQRWAIACAYSVLDVYESKHPNDLRPRAALEAANSYLDNSSEETRRKVIDATAAAYDAAEAAVDVNAARGAYATAEAAVATRAASCAVEAAEEAAKAASSRENQKNVNLRLLIETLNRR